MGEQPEIVKCPICGGEAEKGAVYSRSSLTWLAGEPNWKSRLGAGLYLLGKQIGRFEWIGASYAEGLYCPSCNHIVIASVTPKNYFPDVKK